MSVQSIFQIILNMKAKMNVTILQKLAPWIKSDAARNFK